MTVEVDGDGAWDVVLTADGAELLGACAEALERWRAGDLPPYLDAAGVVDAFDPDFCVGCWLWAVATALVADGRAPWAPERDVVSSCACVDPYGKYVHRRRDALVAEVESMLSHVTAHRRVAVEAVAADFERWTDERVANGRRDQIRRPLGRGPS